MNQDKWNAITQKSNGNRDRSVVRTPQFPGQQLNQNLSIEAIRSFIKKQVRIKGFKYSLVAGSNTGLDVNISGSARLLLGVALAPNQAIVTSPAALPQQCTLTINNEIVIEDLHSVFLSSQYTDEEYYSIMRPLSGQDDVKVQFNEVQSDQDIFLAVYYI